MSLDVYLKLPGVAVKRAPTERIFVRRGGATVEVTQAEWREENPGREAVMMLDEIDERYVYDANITHNMGRMARECGLYEPMWEAQDKGLTHASQLIEPLREGLARLIAEKDRLQEFNPANGWGDYDGLVRFTENYLAACEEWPDAEVRVSR